MTARDAARRVPLLAVASALLLAACGGGATASPEGAARAFAQALRQSDAEGAYALTSERYRRRVPLREFSRWMRENPGELRALADSLEAPQLPPEHRATLDLGDESIELVRGDDGWRVATEVVDYYAQRTPLQTLRSFVRAVAHERYDVLVALIARAERGDLDAEALRVRFESGGREEFERVAAGLRAALDAGTPPQVTADRAVLPWADRQAELVLEDGVWRIVDPG